MCTYLYLQSSQTVALYRNNRQIISEAPGSRHAPKVYCLVLRMHLKKENIFLFVRISRQYFENSDANLCMMYYFRVKSDIFIQRHCYMLPA